MYNFLFTRFHFKMQIRKQNYTFGRDLSTEFRKYFVLFDETCDIERFYGRFEIGQEDKARKCTFRKMLICRPKV